MSDETPPRFEVTRYGFSWGAADIVRIASHRGHVMIEVRTPRARLMIRVTPTGLIRTERIEPLISPDPDASPGEHRKGEDNA